MCVALRGCLYPSTRHQLQNRPPQNINSQVEKLGANQFLLEVPSHALTAIGGGPYSPVSNEALATRPGGGVVAGRGGSHRGSS